MPLEARYVHTNLVARNWRRLATFYQEVFGCELVPPERDLQGPWLNAATGVPEARIQGVHLRLPGQGPDGPTLEVLQYNRLEEVAGVAINRPGFAHIAFAVDDVDAALEAVLKAGGGTVGELVTRTISRAGEITFVYVTDPEGNIIELQSWA
jgi:predicted enzyme related to lactoylglutathione lyase